METKFLHKATFSEVYSFLKNKPDDTIFKCFKNLFDVALLFFPALMCNNVATITDLATGATLVGAGVGTIVGNAAKSAFTFFKNNDHSDYTSKYQQIQIAQVMLVYASYFDTISQILPNENGEIVLSANKKFNISQDAIQAYLNKLKASAQYDSSTLLDTEIALPNPTYNFSLYKENLKNFYEKLNDEFIKFFEQLPFWREIENMQKEYFYCLLNELPQTAVYTYEQQYFELSKEFPEFAVWANHIEHSQLEAQIDVGFKQVFEKLNSIVDHSENKAPATLKHYQRKYADYINNPIIKSSANNFAEDIVFPSQKDIFIPQSFFALSYNNTMKLELGSTWKDVFFGEDIGSYISNMLLHPQYGMLPLLILGLPGAGKTLLCHMLAAQILFAEYHVIIIKLRDTNAEDTIMKQIDAQIQRDFGDDCTWNDIRNASLQKPLLLIFDGYDELLQASGKTYSDYLNKIAEFQLEHEKFYNIFVRCIVTSRTTLIDKASIPHNSQIIRLCDFDDNRIKIWSEIWNNTNEQYFNIHHLKKFKIASSGTVKDLAGQPLLLLMLALYDIGGNYLQEQYNISRSELYYKLIRDFIIREREKDADYNRLEQVRKETEVQNTFRNLGIAALGMYNRKKLFIRSAELSSDLSFLAPKKTESMNEYSLEECDKLVGSFFFIHSSQFTTKTNDVYTKAYEFLHNTFGEFLTAYYILDIAFRLINRQIRDEEQGEPFSWPNELKKEWHICLAYAPLFSRPIILNMLHELSEILAEEKHLEPAKIQDALNCLFHNEFRNIIAGDSFAILNETLKMQDNPFKHPELMIHIATYSVNLILLRATVCTDNFDFTKIFDYNSDWKKLTHIWRYAFSEDELVSLSCFISLEHLNKTAKIVYRYDENALKRTISLSKIGKLHSISNSLGDDTLYAILGAFDSILDQRIKSIIQKDKLELKTQYALNNLMHYLKFSDLQKDKKLTHIMKHLFNCCIAENNPLGLYVYFTLLHNLTELHIISAEYCYQLLQQNIFSMKNGTLCDIDLNYDSLFFVLFLEEVLQCISTLPVKAKLQTLQEFINFFSNIPNLFYTTLDSNTTNNYMCKIFSHFCIILKTVVKESNMKNIGVICHQFIRKIMQSSNMKFSSWHEFISVFQLCKVLEEIEDVGTSNKIFFDFVHRLDIEKFKKNYCYFNMSNLYSISLVVDCYYYIEQISNLDFHVNQFADMLIHNLNIILEKENIFLALFPTYNQSLYHLICIFCDEAICPMEPRYSLEFKLNELISKYGKQLSTNIIRKILECGRLIHSEQICNKVTDLLEG